MLNSGTGGLDQPFRFGVLAFKAYQVRRLCVVVTGFFGQLNQDGLGGGLQGLCSSGFLGGKGL